MVQKGSGSEQTGSSYSSGNIASLFCCIFACAVFSVYPLRGRYHRLFPGLGLTGCFGAPVIVRRCCARGDEEEKRA